MHNCEKKKKKRLVTSQLIESQCKWVYCILYICVRFLTKPLHIASIACKRHFHRRPFYAQIRCVVHIICFFRSFFFIIRCFSNLVILIIIFCTGLAFVDEWWCLCRGAQFHWTGWQLTNGPEMCNFSKRPYIVIVFALATFAFTHYYQHLSHRVEYVFYNMFIIITYRVYFERH